MSNQAPPPPPPAASGGAGGFNPQNLQSDLQGAAPLDLAPAGIGVLAFLLSLIPAWYSASGGGDSDHINAWHGTIVPWLGALLALAAGIVAILPILKVAAPWATSAALGLFGGAFICEIIALFINPYVQKVCGQDGAPAGCDADMIKKATGVDTGTGWVLWLVLILTLAGLVITGLKFAKQKGLA